MITGADTSGGAVFERWPMANRVGERAAIAVRNNCDNRIRMGTYTSDLSDAQRLPACRNIGLLCSPVLTMPPRAHLTTPMLMAR